MTITLHVNAASHEIDADPSTPLLYVLRNELALHGPKFGCGLGQCGATVSGYHLDGRAAFSCILPNRRRGRAQDHNARGPDRKRQAEQAPTSLHR